MAKALDQFSRPLRDLRISVTDQCNFRCAYCMPKEIFGPDYAFLPKSKVLSNLEILRIAQSFCELGVEKIRLTGGEPLLRSDLVELVSSLKKETSIRDLSLTTNASLLPRYASKLKEAGLDRINISLDSLKDDTLEKMSGRKTKATTVLKGIDSALSVGLKTKVNMVVKKGVNDSEIISMATEMRQRAITLRFIEYMDVGNTNQWKLDEVVSVDSILNKLSEHFSFESLKPTYKGEVASRFKYKDINSEFGIINSVTKPFCSNCNRARLSADGKLFTCLFASKGTDIRSVVRKEISSKELTELLYSIWNKRDDRYSELRSNSSNELNSEPRVEMSYIGG
ncbi:GTP 3',8-cyclase MoaA [Puniceicoccaceae bacterium K14]|nr:GTP 3',8-cyclase MoaA [Puniceicoccaceae bacterium K14]